MRPQAMYIAGAAAAVIVIIAGAAWWPVSYPVLTTSGLDAYQYHGPLFGQHTQSQDIIAEQPIESLGALLVRLRPSRETPEAIITFTDPDTHELLQTHTLSSAAFVDDTFTYFTLTPPLPAHRRIRLTFSAPQATADTALGIRFHPDDVYPESQRLFDDKPAAGDLALSWKQRLPAWQVLQQTAAHNPQRTRILLQVAACSLLAAFAAAFIRERRLQFCILAFLGVATVAGHVPALQRLGGVSGGDPYNYLLITQGIAHGQNPWEDKRLPGYPVLLLPAYLTSFDDQLWMRLLNVISAGGSVVLVALLARRLQLPWSVQFMAALLLSVQKDFYWTALRPEPYTVYAFLLLASVWLFFSLTTRPRRILFGFALGYAAMTRQEGFVLAVVLALAALAHIGRVRAKPLTYSYLTAFLPALLFVLPFFVSNAIRYGNPLYTPYFAGERLNIVDSRGAFIDALGSSWGILGSFAKTSWERLERVDVMSSVFLISAAGALLWWLYGRRRFPRQSAAESVGLGLLSLLPIATLLYSYAQSISAFALLLPLTAAMLLVSPLALVGAVGWRGAVVVAVALSQIGVATWFHPFSKHFQQDWPFVALALAALLIVSEEKLNLRRRLAAGASYFAMSSLFAILIVPLYQPGQFNLLIDRWNHATALDSVVYRAIQVARELPGPYAVDDGYLQARLYFEGRAQTYPSPDHPSAAGEAQWLNEQAIQTLVTTNVTGLFTNLPDPWRQTAHFKAESRDEETLESFVYTRR